MSAQESSCGPSQRGRLPPLLFLACPVPAKAGRWWLPEHPILSCLLSFPILFPLWLLWLSPRYTLSILWDQLKSHRLSHFLNPFLLSVMSYWHHYPWSQQGPAVGRVSAAAAVQMLATLGILESVSGAQRILQKQRKCMHCYRGVLVRWLRQSVDSLWKPIIIRAKSRASIGCHLLSRLALSLVPELEKNHCLYPWSPWGKVWGKDIAHGVWRRESRVLGRVLWKDERFKGFWLPVCLWQYLLESSSRR